MERLSKMEDAKVLFEVAKRGKPESIMDFGMTLMENNITARWFGSCKMDVELELFGSNIYEKEILPVYECLYNDIYTTEDALQKETELGVFLIHDCEMLSKVKQLKSKYLLTLKEYEKFFDGYSKTCELSIDSKEYLVLGGFQK